jgi:uncharacterized protein HemY
MNRTDDPFSDPRLLEAPRRRASWLQRLAFVAGGAILVVSAFFFLAMAVVAGTVLAIGVAARIWWSVRRLRARAKENEAMSGPLEGEYTVVNRSPADSRLER